MADKERRLPTRSSSAEVDAFLRKVAVTPATRSAGGAGRLMFAMDATASREPAWDHACHIQGQMFHETAALGGLRVQLCWYRGFGEFEAGPWVDRPDDLLARMTAVSCRAGQTQIERVLRHAAAETRRERVNALVFVGDCMEEDPDRLCDHAGTLGMLGVPVFVFHEGHDPVAEQTFRRIAGLSGGAYCRFDASSAQQLRDLLSAVAVFAAGGRKALEAFERRHGGVVGLLTRQVGKG